MYQTPAPIWNEIAATQTLQHDPWKELFRLKGEKQLQALEQLESQLSTRGADSRVIRSYLLVAPLLLENVAISKWLMENEDGSLRSSMPELTSIPEAVALATQEFRLLPSQAKKLTALLTEAYRTPPSAAPSEPPKA